ncbi:MAG: hypothetical protein GX491_04160 [Chloroflexi bacterium]|nr:hypothetical protein [Chloroflexota bacterium]
MASEEAGKAVSVSTYVITTLLWLVSLGLSVAATYYIYALSILVYSILGGSQFFAGILVGQVSALVSGMIWVALMIVTGEYYLKHIGEKKIWKIAATVIGIQLIIILVGLFATGAI